MSAPYQCKEQCIDKGYIFCPSLDHTSGTCYNQTDVITRIAGCSTDISDANLKYWMCNYNTNCSSTYKIAPPGFGVKNVTTLSPLSLQIFTDNVCAYLISFPWGASVNDTISFRANLVDRATLYFMIGTSFSDSGAALKGPANIGTIYQATWP